MIVDKEGIKKEYIYKNDIRKFLKCSSMIANRIFELVKGEEIEIYQIEMFKNRVPQDLFHRIRKRKKSS